VDEEDELSSHSFSGHVGLGSGFTSPNEKVESKAAENARMVRRRREFIVKRETGSIYLSEGVAVVLAAARRRGSREALNRLVSSGRTFPQRASAV
jgi:hypothetical protein